MDQEIYENHGKRKRPTYQTIWASNIDQSTQQRTQEVEAQNLV
jgi:hypothetical protein